MVVYVRFKGLRVMVVCNRFKCLRVMVVSAARVMRVCRVEIRAGGSGEHVSSAG